jgi:hypothetical protein
MVLPICSIKLILLKCLSFWLTTYLVWWTFFNRQSAFMWVPTSRGLISLFLRGRLHTGTSQVNRNEVGIAWIIIRIQKNWENLRQVGGFLRVLRFPPPIKPPRYNWNIVESSIKYHNPNLYNITARLCKKYKIYMYLAFFKFL